MNKFYSPQPTAYGGIPRGTVQLSADCNNNFRKQGPPWRAGRRLDAQLVNKFAVFNGTGKSTAVLTRARPWTSSWTTQIHSTLPSFKIESPTCAQSPRCSLSPFSFPNSNSVCMHAKCPAHWATNTRCGTIPYSIVSTGPLRMKNQKATRSGLF
jgi:hypothetical protein